MSVAKPRAWTPELRQLGTRKEVRQLLEEVQDLGGWEGCYGGQGHILLRHKSGYRVTLSATPADGRSLKNTRAEIKRAVSRCSD